MPLHTPTAPRASLAPQKAILAPEPSAVLRAHLMADLEVIITSEDAIAWARQRLPAKNTLTVDDARIVEDAFQAKMAALAADQDPASIVGATATDTAGAWAETGEVSPPAISRPDLPATNVTVVPKPHRLRDKRHREFVAAQRCVIRGRKPSDAHHLRLAQPRALGRKVSDEFTVPLCREHHGELHRAGNESRWWKDAGIDAIAIARNLWAQTQSNGPSATRPNVLNKTMNF
jgi:hypothetical protein